MALVAVALIQVKMAHVTSGYETLIQHALLLTTD